MKSTTILTGNFAKSAGNKGNFTGYNSAGDQIFIAKAMIEKLGIKKDADFTDPIYALIDERIITPNDANGQPMQPTARLQALSLYKTIAELVQAKNADAVLAIEERKHLEAMVGSADLSEASVNAILSASSFL